MTPAIRPPLGGLDPTPQQARDWVKQELQGSEYRSPWLQSVIRWITDQLSSLLNGVRDLAGLSPAVTALMAITVIAILVWVLPRVRREPTAEAREGAVLEDLTITSRRYRDLAAQAARDGRYDDAVLDGFRAIAKDMSDRRVLTDAPGRTAHEVALALASPFPDHADRLARAADLFDSVRYGHRSAGVDQADRMLLLDADLATTRAVLGPALHRKLPV